AEPADRAGGEARPDRGARRLRVPLRRRGGNPRPQLHLRPRPRAGAARRQAAGPAAPGKARVRQRRPGDDRGRHPQRPVRRRLRRAGRTAGRRRRPQPCRRRLGDTPAHQAFRALDLAGRGADGAGRLRHRAGQALPRTAGTAPGREGTGEWRMNPTPRRPRVAIVIGTVCFLAFLTLLFYGVRQSGRGDREALPSPLIGKPAPDFTLPLLHEPGRLVTSKDLLGAPYVLNVWGSWCPECRVEHPVLTRFALTKRVRV